MRRAARRKTVDILIKNSTLRLREERFEVEP
jgi:hypothetical protein